MTLGEIKDQFDFYWVFVPRRDSWRLCKLAGEARIPVFHDGGAWLIFPEKVEEWEAIGIEMPRHPRSVSIPKSQP